MIGVRTKIERTEESINNLDVEMAAVLSTTPPSYKVVGYFENNGLEYVLKAKGEIVVPPRIPVLIGEVVHNLRSALDHLITALVVKNKGTPTNRHQFPICTSAEKFKDAIRGGLLKDVSSSAAEIIESVQRYTSPTPTDTVLHVIRDLNNLDKHRLLIVTASAVSTGRRITVGRQGSELLDIHGNRVVITGISLQGPQQMTKEGVEILKIFFLNPVAKFDAKIEVAVHIAFAELGLVKIAPVTEMLLKLLLGVQHTIGLFKDEV